MEEIIVTNSELASMFINGQIYDKNDGWYYQDKQIEIIAIHEREIKYIQDITKAETYKLRFR